MTNPQCMLPNRYMFILFIYSLYMYFLRCSPRVTKRTRRRLSSTSTEGFHRLELALGRLGLGERVEPPPRTYGFRCFNSLTKQKRKHVYVLSIFNSSYFLQLNNREGLSEHGGPKPGNCPGGADLRCLASRHSRRTLHLARVESLQWPQQMPNT